MQKKGVLLAISSLPGKYGIGDFSDEAFKFIKILENNNVKLWQILPLNPIGYGHSPYQPFSSFAFDEIYISLEDLKHKGLIGHFNKVKPHSMTDYEKARKIKEEAIKIAYDNFIKNRKNRYVLRKFIKENPYIDEYSTFITLKELNNGLSWDKWTVIKEQKTEEFNLIKNKHAFAQMILYHEWEKIRKFANSHGVEIIGDVPFYVGYDSSDVYFHKEAFMLDENYKPTCIAGVPPDYFSKDGQRWGNPIWNWEHLYNSEFKAMLDRIFFASKFYDIVRLDHFRAFDSYWSINPECETAVDGEWKYPHGDWFFDTLFYKYPEIKVIVEDLGELRPEVLELRDKYHLAGTRELEFAIFDDEFLDKRVERENQVYYTSTHDNETLLEWVSNLKRSDKALINERLEELGMDGKNLVEKLIKYAYSRKEKYIIVSVSDILSLNKTHRMNVPGIIDDFNWRFKLQNFNKFARRIGKFIK